MDILAYILAKAKAKAYTDTRIDSIIPGFDYKGSVATVADLPATGNTKGDCYNVTDGSGVYAWNGTSWGSASKVGPTGATGPQGQQGPRGNDGSTVSVSGTGSSTNDVRYITIDGTQSRFSAVALKAMKSSWVTGTTLEAANAILADDSVVQGDGFLATVYWSDLPGNLTQAEVKAFVMKKGTSYQKIIQFECTSGTVAPYSWFYNSYERVWRSQVPLNNTLTSTATNEALTANMGKALQDQINNLKYSGTITGDGATTNFVVTHNRGSQSVIVQVYNNATHAQVAATVVLTSANTASITFSEAPAQGAVYTVVCV